MPSVFFVPSSINHPTKPLRWPTLRPSTIGQQIFASEDWAEGVRSFVEKRKAVFTGR